MKNPLYYQLSEYDCGPTSMLNALSFLFERAEIPPEVIRNIMLYCLDSYNAEGVCGKSGTSRAAMMFLSNWLNGYGKVGQLPVSSRYLAGECVYIGQDSYICDALRRGGVAVVRLFLDDPHYVLLTGEREGHILVFDPYLLEEPLELEGVRTESGRPCEYNRVIDPQVFNRETTQPYALGPMEGREAVLLFNSRTKLTEEKTIEYFI